MFADVDRPSPLHIQPLDLVNEFVGFMRKRLPRMVVAAIGRVRPNAQVSNDERVVAMGPVMQMYADAVAEFLEYWTRGDGTKLLQLPSQVGSADSTAPKNIPLPPTLPLEASQSTTLRGLPRPADDAEFSSFLFSQFQGSHDGAGGFPQVVVGSELLWEQELPGNDVPEFGNRFQWSA